MADKNDQPRLPVQAPTYTELFNLATDLQARLALLEEQLHKPPQVLTDSSSEVVAAPTYTDFRLLPDLNRSVPVFTGHESSCAAEDWLGSVDALAVINNWPVPYQLQFVKSNLTTAARSWYLTERFTDWSDFLAKFRAVFVRSLRMTDRWKALTDRIQGEAEHIADYYYDKFRLCQDLKLDFAETREQIITGIRSQEFVTFAMSKVHNSGTALLADLQEREHLYELRRMQFPTQPKTIPIAKSNKSFPPLNSYRRDAGDSTSTPEAQKVAPDAVKRPRSVFPSTVRCYNCNANGHIGRDCPKPRKPCSICKSITHSRGQCPAATGAPPTHAQTYRAECLPIAVERNCFIKDVCFNDIHTTCLIDSGSSNVLVRASLADRSGTVVDRVFRPLFTVGDAYQPSVITLGEATADITIDGAYAAEHPVLVVSDDSIPVDVLVGRTWLNLPHISYYKRQDEFVIESLNVISPSSTSERVAAEASDVYVALVNAEKPPLSPLSKSDVNVDAQVPDNVCHRLLLLMNEYRDVFAKTLSELGCTDVHEMNIVEVTGSAPVRQRPYRISPTDRRTIARILDEWRMAGIISNSTSPYASPVLLVNKGTGEKRLCIDYRLLNQQTIDQPYPMPEIDDLLSQLVEGHMFTTMDLSNGFLQIPLSEDAKEKTAFVTEETTAKFERMPFGLKVLPVYFRRP